MSNDTELEIWRKEWRDQTEPLADLKKKIRRQNLRTVAAVLAICVALAVSSGAALRTRSYFLAGVAAGIAFAGLFMGGYAAWVRRGAWKPAAQTTLAYAELSYRRAVARARIARFSFRFLLVATVLLAILVVWNWRHFHARDGVILAAMVAELFFFRRLAGRKQHEISETRKLLESLRD